MRRLRLHLSLLALAFVPGTAGSQSQSIPMPTPAAPETVREYLRLERIADDWSVNLARAHRLARASCRIQLPPTPRSACAFFLDGVALHVWKEGRGSTSSVGAILSFGNEINIAGGRIEVIGGQWVSVGDLFELETPGGVYAWPCEALGEGDYVTAQCSRLALNFQSIADRATHPAARYNFDGATAETDVGSAFLSGSPRIWHNGDLISLDLLAEAARNFAREDFDRLVSR